MANPVTIYHNPRCSTSRRVLATIREHGIEPIVVEYLKTPPDRAVLERILAATGLEPRGLMRRKEPVYAELGLADPGLGRAALLDALITHPVLIERPIVVTAKGTVVCRPPERVAEVL